MRTLASLLVLLLPLVVGDPSSRAGTRTQPSTEILTTIIESHFQAIERNSHKSAMSYFHSNAPDLADIEEELKYVMSGYLQTIGTFTYSNVELQGQYAVAQARHEFLIITGVKFISKTVDATYRFKEEEGLWKIWSQQVAHFSYFTGVLLSEMRTS